MHDPFKLHHLRSAIELKRSELAYRAFFWCPRCCFFSIFHHFWIVHNCTWSFIIIFCCCCCYCNVHLCIWMYRYPYTRRSCFYAAIFIVTRYKKYHCHKQHKRQREIVSEKIAAKKKFIEHIWTSGTRL